MFLKFLGFHTSCTSLKWTQSAIGFTKNTDPYQFKCFTQTITEQLRSTGSLKAETSLLDSAVLAIPVNSLIYCLFNYNACFCFRKWLLANLLILCSF